jgi:hypothetical protein
MIKPIKLRINLNNAKVHHIQENHTSSLSGITFLIRTKPNRLRMNLTVLPLKPKEKKNKT